MSDSKDSNQTEALSISDLSDTNFDTALTMGVIPLVIFGILAVMAIGIFVMRKKQSSWDSDESGNPTGDSDNLDPSFPTTKELENMQATEPAEKLEK